MKFNAEAHRQICCAGEGQGRKLSGEKESDRERRRRREEEEEEEEEVGKVRCRTKQSKWNGLNRKGLNRAARKPQVVLSSIRGKAKDKLRKREEWEEGRMGRMGREKESVREKRREREREREEEEESNQNL